MLYVNVRLFCVVLVAIMRTRKSEKSQWVSGDTFRFHTPKMPHVKESRRKTHGGTSSWIHKSAQKSCMRQMSATARTRQSSKSIRFSVLEEQKNGSYLKTQRMMRSLLKPETSESIRFSVLEEQKNGSYLKTQRMISLLKPETSDQEKILWYGTKELKVNIESLSPNETHLNKKKRAVSDVDIDMSTKKVKKQVTKKPNKSSQKNKSDTKKRLSGREASLNNLLNRPGSRKTRSKALKQTDRSSAKHSPKMREASPVSPSKNPSPKLNSSNKGVMSTTKSPEKKKTPQSAKRTPPKRMKSEKSPSPQIAKRTPPKRMQSAKSPSPQITKKTSPKIMKSPKSAKSPPKEVKSPTFLKSQSPKSPKVITSPSLEKIGNIQSAKSPSPKLKKDHTESPKMTDSTSLNNPKVKRTSEMKSSKVSPSPLMKRKAITSFKGKSPKKQKTPSPEKLKSPRKLERKKELSSPGPSKMSLMKTPSPTEKRKQPKLKSPRKLERKKELSSPGQSKMSLMKTPSPIEKRKPPTKRAALHVKSPSPRMKSSNKTSFKEEHMDVEMIKENLPVLWNAQVNQEEIKTTSTDIYLNGTDENEAGHSSYTSLKGNSESSIFEDKLEDLKKGADLFEEQAENDILQGHENSSFWSCNIL